MQSKSFIRLTTVADIVSVFGGPAAMGAWAGISGPAISNWIARGWIPPDWFLAVSEELQRKGFEAPPEIFRQVPVKQETDIPTAVGA